VHKRTRCGIVVESGEPREVMHFALLCGYGAGAINPYLAFEAISNKVEEGKIKEDYPGSAHKKFIKAIEKGLYKNHVKNGYIYFTKFTAVPKS
jgi:hypothetical protein